MRKIFIALVMLLSLNAFSQTDYPKHQVNLNILNAIAIASVEVGYEHFIDFNQSLEAELFFNDRFSYFSQKGETKYSATSFKLGYNYYFDLEGLSGPYINPFIKQRFGNLKKDGYTNGISAFGLGIGVGYIWNYNDTFIVAPYVNLTRDFGRRTVNGETYFWPVEPNAGVKIGYRF